MIYVSKEVAANESVPSGHPKLSRSDIWKGLVMKAENALPFVPGMAKCNVVKRTPNGLIRDIIFRGEDARERITLYPEKKVVFVRESGNVDGFIVNEILGEDDDLRLRFSFALQLVDAASDSRRGARVPRDHGAGLPQGGRCDARRHPQNGRRPTIRKLGRPAMKYWFSDMYADIDAMRLDAFAAALAPDIKVVVGNNPAMSGRQAAKEGIGYFFSTDRRAQASPRERR